MGPVRCFPRYICLCLASEGRGEGVRLWARERNHWSSSQCLCLCLAYPLSHSLSFFPQIHNSKQLHFFPPFSLPVSPPPPSLPCLYTPASLYSPAFVCAPVWLLAWSVWTLRRRKTHQVERSWEELCGWEERGPVVRASGFSIGNPDVCASFIRKAFGPNATTHIQNTNCRECVEMSEILTAWLPQANSRLSVCAYVHVIVTKLNWRFRFHISAGSSVFRGQVSDNYPVPCLFLFLHKHISTHTADPMRTLTSGIRGPPHTAFNSFHLILEVQRYPQVNTLRHTTPLTCLSPLTLGDMQNLHHLHPLCGSKQKDPCAEKNNAIYYT